MVVNATCGASEMTDTVLAVVFIGGPATVALVALAWDWWSLSHPSPLRVAPTPTATYLRGAAFVLALGMPLALLLLSWLERGDPMTAMFLSWLLLALLLIAEIARPLAVILLVWSFVLDWRARVASNKGIERTASALD